MTYHRWAYFLTMQEIVTVFKERGGSAGTFNPDNPDDVHHARRALFLYLIPARIQVWLAMLDEQLGIVFFVGKPTLNLRKAVDRDLAKRCMAVFRRSPSPCQVVGDPSIGVLWDLAARDSSMRRLNLMELLQSDRDGDLYPLSPEEYALLVEQGKETNQACPPEIP